MILRKLLMLVFLAVAVCVMSGGVGAAAVITVDDSGGADFATIQAAVDAASAGDTIEVRSGTYVENVDVYKSLTIQSVSGAEATIVQAANPNDHAFEVMENYVKISGFMVKGAEGWPKAGIYLYYVKDCEILNNNLLNNKFSIYIYSSNSSTIAGNTINDNDHGGIAVYWGSCNNNINSNNISNNYGSGINIGGGAGSGSNNNIIIENTINNNNIGIYLGNPADDNIIRDNIVNDNNYNGIYLFGSNNNTFTDNNISENNNYGIGLFISTNNIIKKNNVTENNYGIYFFGSSSDNLLYHNNLIDNTQNTYDSCTNQWDSGSEGNYYSDYTGTDSDSDGIGDTTYPIPGGSSVDR